ncbi:MAG: hypothetical protein AB7U82_04915 [Blastocatellales bacterium]
MSNKVNTLPSEDQQPDWSALLEELRQEYWASTELTEEQKGYLDSLDDLPEEEWEPIVCEGKPLSETIIEDRGPR